MYDLLRESEIEPILDQIHEQEVDEHDWPLWTRQQVDRADYVVVIASPAYKRRSDTPHEVPRNVGRGVWWEADYIRGYIYDDKGRSYRRILPVVLPGGSEVFLPSTMFRPDHPVFRIPELTAAGMHDLVEVLSGRVPVPWPDDIPLVGWVFAGPEGREGVRGHIERRGRGRRSVSRGGDLFRGRVIALNAVTDWLDAEQPPGQVLIVTGQPGAGKSAVAARAALNLEPAAIETGQLLGLVFHARSATLLDFLHAVAVTTGTDAAESIEAMIANLIQAGPPASGWWRIVVDALDETATSTDRNHLVQALAELAALPSFRVVVATRALSPDPTNPTASMEPLLARLGVTGLSTANLIDLDTDRYFEPSGLLEFASASLRQDGALEPGPPGRAWQTYRTDDALRQRLAAAIAARADRNHLVAALTADALAKQPDVIDPSAVGFDRASLPTSVGEALGKYFEALGKRLGDELRAEAEQARIRSLLVALAYARGAGVTDQMWIALARALGRQVGMDELDALRLGTVADFLLQTSTVDGERVTRLFHQALVDELLATRPRAADETKILGSLTPTSPATWLDATAYARTFAAEHAAVAGRLDLLLDDPAYAIVADMARLLPALPESPPAPVSAAVDVLRAAGRRAGRLPPPRRAGLFALAAAHLGHPDLQHRYEGMGMVTVAWAHPLSHPHQVLTGHDGDVLALAPVPHLRHGGSAWRFDRLVSGVTTFAVDQRRARYGAPSVEKMLGALPVVAEFSRRFELREIIDAACPMRQVSTVGGESRPGYRSVGGQQIDLADAVVASPGLGCAVGRAGCVRDVAASTLNTTGSDALSTRSPGISTTSSVRSGPRRSTRSAST